MSQIVNAKIDATMLGMEDHGIFTCFLYLDYGGTSQGFGGYGLDEYDEEQNKRIDKVGYTGEFVKAILETVGVDTWEKLKGQHIRVEREDGWSGGIIAIGNLLKDEWFNPKEFFDAHFS